MTVENKSLSGKAVALRNKILDQQIKANIKGLGWQLIICALLVLNIFITIGANNWRTYFAVDASGRHLPIAGLNAPVATDNVIVSYGVRCATRAFTYSADTFRQDFEEARKCFSDAGWSNFLKALEEAGTDKELRNTKLLISQAFNDEVSGPPVLVDEGVGQNGRYFYVIEFNLKRHFQVIEENQLRYKRSASKAIVRIERVKYTEAELGYAVVQIITR